MNIDSSLGQPYESIPVDFGTSLNWSSAHWHDQGATSDSDHDMEVRNRSSTLSQSGSPTSSMTPPEIQSNAHGNWFHPTFYSNPFNQSITPADAPSTSGFSGISINEPSSSKTALGHCFLPAGAVPAPHSRGQHQELYTAPYPQTGGYPIYNYGLPFSAEDADYEKTSEAVRPSREDYGQSFDDNKIFSKRAQEKLAKSKELRARRRNAATNPSASGSGSTSRHMIASINRSSMENPGFPYYYASNTHHSRKGLADANSQSIVDSGRCPPTEDTVRGRDPASHDLSTLRNLQEAEVSGVFVNTSAPLEVSVYHGVSSMPPPNNGLAHNYSSTVATPESSEHSGYEIYYKYLSVKQRGTPLWEPGPHLRLPPTYRENGVSIGDVGILNSTMGAFIFLFNIFLSASHEINRGRVPHGFRPLDGSKAEQSLKENDIYDRCLASSSLKRTGSSDFAFETTGREGAVLVMPNGGLSEDLENYKLLKSYIASYAESWWEYVESEDCGVPTENGIQVVVGTDKVSSWGMTTFENVIEPMKFEFNSEGIASQTRTSNWKGINGRAGPTEKEIGLLTGPTASPLCNQCVFVRTLNVSVPGKVRDKLAIEVCASCSRDCMCDSSRHEGQPRQRNVEIQASQVGLSQVSHPSKLLNRYLLEKCPNAKVVITCDLDWIRVITENDTTMPSAEDICARILSSHAIYEKKGVVTLGKWQNIVSAGDDPSVTGSGTLGNDEWARFDNLDPPSGDDNIETHDDSDELGYCPSYYYCIGDHQEIPVTDLPRGLPPSSSMGLHCSAQDDPTDELNYWAAGISYDYSTGDHQQISVTDLPRGLPPSSSIYLPFSAQDAPSYGTYLLSGSPGRIPGELNARARRSQSTGNATGTTALQVPHVQGTSSPANQTHTSIDNNPLLLKLYKSAKEKVSDYPIVQASCTVRKHAESAPFVCKYCSATFTRPHYLAYHLKFKHFKPARCSFCGKEFRTWGILRRHQDKHKEHQVSDSGFDQGAQNLNEQGD